jgi:hypothetical protein
MERRKKFCKISTKTAFCGLTTLRLKRYGLQGSTPSMTASMLSNKNGGEIKAVKLPVNERYQAVKLPVKECCPAVKLPVNEKCQAVKLPVNQSCQAACQSKLSSCL